MSIEGTANHYFMRCERPRLYGGIPRMEREVPGLRRRMDHDSRSRHREHDQERADLLGLREHSRRVHLRDFPMSDEYKAPHQASAEIRKHFLEEDLRRKRVRMMLVIGCTLAIVSAVALILVDLGIL